MPYGIWCTSERDEKQKHPIERTNEQNVSLLLSRALFHSIFFPTSERTFKLLFFVRSPKSGMEHVRYKIMAIGIIDIAWYSRRES